MENNTNNEQQNNFYDSAQNGQNTYANQETNNSQMNNNYYGQNGNTYGTFNGNSYGNYNGNTYGTYNGNQYNGGQTPFDNNGQPLKNRFGMKLTFSILEIIACNLISLICGIIGCVYTCKANTAYKEGRWEDFKSAAKSSKISLWIGFAGVILQVVLVLVAFFTVGLAAVAAELGLEDYADGQQYYYEEDADDDDSYTYNYDDEAGSDATVSDYLPEVEGPGYVDHSFVSFGKAIELPCTIADIEAIGYEVADYDRDVVVEADDYEFLSCYNENDNYLMIWVDNNSDQDVNAMELPVLGAYFMNNGDATPEMFSMNGFAINFDTTQNELLAAFGTPDYCTKTNSDGTVTEEWEWYGEGDDVGYYRCLSFYFEDGETTEIDVEWSDYLD